MDTEPKKTNDISIKRILIVAALLGLGCFLLAGLPQYFPDHTDIIARLAATLAFAVVIVVVHHNFSASRRSDRNPAPAATATGRYATVTRILVVWLVLFLLNTFFFAF